MSKSDNTDCIDEILYCGKHAQVAFQRMEEFFMKGLLFDVTLLVGTKRIKAHRIVLCAMSKYFMTMFTSPVDGAIKDVIEMKDVDSEALSTVVRSFYSGKIKLSMETADAILATAHYLLLTDIVDACCNFLMLHLNPSNSLGIQMLANMFECSSLIKATTGYIEDHFLEIIQTQEFRNLSKSDINLLLSSDSIKVPSEENVFQGLMLWLNHDLKCREEYITELLALINLPNLSAQFLINHIKVHPLIKDNISCQNLITEAMMCQLIPSKLLESLASWTNCRKSRFEGFYIMGGKHSSKEFALTVEKYDFTSNSWTSVSTMSKTVHCGMTVLNNKIYVMGGQDGTRSLNSFKCYYPKENLWTSLSPMPFAKLFPGAVVLNGDIYAIGGISNGHLCSTVERWTPATGKWDSRQPMHTAKSRYFGAVLNETLYVVGEGAEHVECYDPYNDQWAVVSAGNWAYYGMAVVAAKGFLYVIGGRRYPQTNDNYDTVRRHPEYKDNRKKDKIWDDIGSKVNEDGESIKKKWRHLRDTHNKYIKTCKTSTGLSANHSAKTWVGAGHYGIFERTFIICHNYFKRSYRTFGRGKSVSGLGNYFSQSSSGTSSINNECCIDDIGGPNINDTSDSSARCSTARKKRKINGKESTAVDKVIEYLKADSSIKNENLDAMDHTFLGFSKTVKTFRSRQQAEIKFKIMKIITEEEILQCDEQEALLRQHHKFSSRQKYNSTISKFK